MPWAFTFLPYAESGWTSLLVRFHIQINFRLFQISSLNGTRRVALQDSWTSMPKWTKFDWRRLWKLENDLHLRVYPCSCSKWLLPYQTSLLWRHLVTGAHTYAQRPAEASDCGMDHGFLTGQSLWIHSRPLFLHSCSCSLVGGSSALFFVGCNCVGKCGTHHYRQLDNENATKNAHNITRNNTISIAYNNNKNASRNYDKHESTFASSSHHRFHPDPYPHQQHCHPIITAITAVKITTVLSLSSSP